MVKVERQLQSIDIGKLRGSGQKILKLVGWFLLLYVVVVACIHISSAPFLLYRFYNGTWSEPLDAFMESNMALLANSMLYLSLNISGLLIFLFRKKKLEQTSKTIDLKKIPLITAIFFAMPFSYHFYYTALGLCQLINPFYYLQAFFSALNPEAFLNAAPTNLLEVYIGRVVFLWSDTLTLGYMLTIFCTYYVIKQLYLYFHQNDKSY